MKRVAILGPGAAIARHADGADVRVLPTPTAVRRFVARVVPGPLDQP